MKYIAFFLLLFISVQAIAQGYVSDGAIKGGMYPYATAGINSNESVTGFQGGLGIKTYGKDYAPLGGQVELSYLNTGTNTGIGTNNKAPFLNFSFMGAVTTFRKYYNYHVAIGPSIMFDISTSGNNSALYNFYPRIEGGMGYGKFMLKLGANFTLNSSYTNLYSLTACFYPTRKRTWVATELR